MDRFSIIAPPADSRMITARQHTGRKGDRIGAVLPNCPQFVIAQLGAWKAGAIAVHMNPHLALLSIVLPMAQLTRGK